LKTAKQMIRTRRQEKGRRSGCDSGENSEGKPSSSNSDALVEVLAEGQECPFCHFAKLKREDSEIVCPICGYGRQACT
jgi:ribosomal protein L37AE/L43A